MSNEQPPGFGVEAIDPNACESDVPKTEIDSVQAEREARKQEVMDAQAAGPSALADFLLKDEIARYRRTCD